MLKPRALRPGDRIAVVSPASPFNRDEFDAGVAELRNLGFEAVYDESVFAREGYVSGPPGVRAAAIRRALEDPSIAALIAARGGYGSAQVLPLLDRDEIRRARKPFIGYSDVTALLTYLTVGCGLVAFHGPMLDRRLSRGAAGYDAASLLAAVTASAVPRELAPEGLEVVRRGEARGPLYGGTITQLLASLATPYAFDPPAGAVLLLEEVGERPYRLDRQLLQLAQANLLGRASAVVVGELPGCDEPSGEVRGRDVVTRLLADFHGPVLIGFPTGHTTGPSTTLPLGVECRVVADGRPRLVIEETAVE
ncbi:MAG TPA: LD-carboxypeptidase [Vicinamibacterales bacterium]|jgi:muramoyltetrapeptide carboxypeptidase|nr:LD-carboxypeptidase [Vicinamibacterales bacterium]